MALSEITASFSKLGMPTDDRDDSLRATLTAQRDATAFFEKYDRRELQELLTLTTCNWLMCGDDFTLPVELPPGIIKQMKNFTQSNITVLAPYDSSTLLDYKVVHQIIRELTVGIYCFNQVPIISLEPNYDKSTTCQLTPAYFDTKVGQILINIDYTIKALWHGAIIPRDKRVRFSELWRSSMGVDSSGVPQTKKNMLTEFLTAGLMDISEDPAYQGIYVDPSPDPTYNPNHTDEERLFQQYSDSVLLKLTSYLTATHQQENLFSFESTHSLASGLRLTEDKLELATYQRLQQRLARQVRVVRESLARRPDVRTDLAYLHLITFLVPLLVGLKKKMKIPDLSKVLPGFSGDKLKTERELPPLILGPAFACKHFPYKEYEYFHLHGGIEIDVGTPNLAEFSQDIKGNFTNIQRLAADCLNDLLHQDTTYKEHFPIPVIDIDGKSYHVISIELGSLYPQPCLTQWWEALNSSIKALRKKRLPLTDIQLHEEFKKTFGYKKAIQCKSVPFGLRAAAERGLSAVFQTLCRKNSPSHLGAIDEQGYTLLHHAAIHNQTHVVCLLAVAGVNLNQARSRRFNHTVKNGVDVQLKEGTGPTPLHLAAQCGSLEALNCLLALQADYTIVDRRGWMAVHFAAYYGHVACIQALWRKDADLVECRTNAEYRSSPLLLSATSGAVEALQYLLSIGADWRQTDSKGNNAVQLAALYFHIDVLLLLTELNLEGLPVWKILVDMLHSEDHRRLEMSIRCLEVLCVRVDTFWKDIMDAGGIVSLVELLRSGKALFQRLAAAVVCHVSERPPVCEALVRYGAVPALVHLLSCPQPELHSRCAVILADMAAHSDQYKVLIAQLGGITLLVKLLSSSLQDVLVNTVRCLRTLCVGSPASQSAVAQSGGIPHLVEFLMVNSEALQEEACLALAELALGHRENQEDICSAGAVSPLVRILRSRRMPAQVKAARALEAIADHNATIQTRFLKTSATKHLLRLLKVFQVDIREQGAVSLWALAGQTLRQQKQMAESIGYHYILDLLLSSSDRMQYVGCQAVIALSHDCSAHQNGLLKENVVPPLVRLLRGTRTKERTLLSVITALASLCMGVAHTNNTTSQGIIYEEKAIPTLLELLKTHESLHVKVQVAQTLACVLLGNLDLQAVFWEQEEFSYEIILDLLQLPHKNICLEAGYALSLFAYNNTSQQTAILKTGGVSIAIYESFLESDNETERAKAAFQTVVLAKVITDTDHVTLSARGVTILSELLQSHSPDTVVLTAELLASLAHTRAGIPDAIVTMGSVVHLSAHLNSPEEEVRTACATALGYLTFNRHAHRLLLVECRNTPSTYDLLTQHLSEDAKISSVFTDEFRRQKIVGLPSLSLEINGGPPVLQRSATGMSKRLSDTTGLSESKTRFERTKSAPVLQLHRAKSRPATVRAGTSHGSRFTHERPPQDEAR
ncbi:ankyrin and armadillo repeat-containing protein [Alosa sapidissima]|uniref:ankyrin and armadillo repeat-containing protein n=1 Tax=Alosa sapidissima TaxID=34773 RepID=UPI001C087A43|nr:ankyrin and armadillo repeat-containing protein [Alosa sapidissima]